MDKLEYPKVDHLPKHFAPWFPLKTFVGFWVGNVLMLGFNAWLTYKTGNGGWLLFFSCLGMTGSIYGVWSMSCTIRKAHRKWVDEDRPEWIEAILRNHEDMVAMVDEVDEVVEKYIKRREERERDR